MGIFGNEYETFVDTSVVRMLEDTQIPNVGKNALAEAILTGKQPVNTLIETLLNDATLNYHKAYNFAKNGGYVYGLPDTEVITNGRGATEIRTAIESEIGETISIEYIEFAQLNHTHLAWETLFNTLDYDRQTNEIKSLSIQEGFPVYLDKIVPTYRLNADDEPELGQWAQWGESSLSGWTPERQNNTTHNSYLAVDPKIGLTEINGYEIHYVWQDANEDIQRSANVYDISAYAEQEYFHVRYTYVDTNLDTQVRHWTYAIGTGTHTDVDTLYTLDYSNAGTYFPFVVFRRNDTNRSDDAYIGTQEYESTKKLLKYLGLDFKSVGDSIHQSPDINDVDQAVMMMGVPANSTEQVELEYLFKFFDRLNDQTPYSEVENNPYKVTVTVPNFNKRKHSNNQTEETKEVPRASYAIVFRDADFRMTLSYGGIIKQHVAGDLGGGIGFYENVETRTTYSTSVYDVAEPGYVRAQGERSEGINRVYRKQVSEGFYEEIIVIDPTVRYSIRNDMGTVGNAKDGRMLIPLDKSLCDEISHMKRSKLYPRSLHFVLNARVKVKLEWYQTTFFRAVLTIVIIAVTIMSGGAGAFLNSLLLAASAGFVAFMLFVIKVLIYRYVINYTFRLIIKEMGVELGLMLAVLAAAAGLASYQDLMPGISSTLAPLLLQLSTGLVQASQFQLKQDTDDLLEDINDFETFKSEKEELLSTTQELLNQDVTLSPFVIFGETPNEYYNRSIHAGNIAMSGVEFIESFIDTSLKLPDTIDTLGGIHV